MCLVCLVNQVKASEYYISPLEIAIDTLKVIALKGYFDRRMLAEAALAEIEQARLDDEARQTL